MRDRPDGAHLLRLARRAVLEDLMPALPEEGRLAARLVANAMAIATREMDAGEADLRAQCQALEDLFGEVPMSAESSAATESLAEALTRLSWRLAAEVRAGGRDADPEVHALLVQGAAARLALVRADAGKR